eukprot:1160317-Pelagomonas_calceolata.AAC.21
MPSSGTNPPGARKVAFYGPVCKGSSAFVICSLCNSYFLHHHRGIRQKPSQLKPSRNPVVQKAATHTC